jgi:hypothetical protein
LYLVVHRVGTDPDSTPRSPAYIKAYTEYWHPESEDALSKKNKEYYRIILTEEEYKLYIKGKELDNSDAK